MKVKYRKCDHEYKAPRRNSKILICLWCNDWKHNPRKAGQIIREVK